MERSHRWDERLIDIKTGENLGAFLLCLASAFSTSLPDELESYVDTILIHKGVLSHVFKGEFVGWAGGMTIL